MLKYLSISKQNPQFPAYLDFQILRQMGIDRLQQLSGEIWTDYNLHDPGITILEVLCYAITDLGYRNNLDIEDLLTLPPNASEDNFFTPDQVLTCNPVTMLDIRKRLIDIPGVHNAWLEKVTTYEPPIWIDVANHRLTLTVPPNQIDKPLRLNPKGLYKVYLDLDPNYHKNACGLLEQSWSGVLDEVKQVLCRYRNLCEDIYDIVVLGEEEIRVCADVELEADADGEDALVELYSQIQSFLVPQLQFYTLQQLLAKHQSTAEIFAGRPSRHDLGELYQSNGFIDTHELETLTLPKILHISDFYQKILDIPGIAAIKKLLLASSINGLPQTQESLWYLQLTEQYRPVLDIQNSMIRLFKNGLPVRVNLDEVKRRYYEQQAAYIKTKRDPYELDLAIPRGQYFATLANHYSIHHDFPLTYGISEDGLPEPVSVQRQAQVKQLKGYLVFFDQLLANYLSQLSHTRNLFSWKVEEIQTYFDQPIQFPGSQDILQEDYLNAVEEEEATARDRRSRFLDHLLARFAESFSDYVLLNYKLFDHHQDKVEHERHLIQEKARFFKDYPELSRDRFRGFNYCNCRSVWNTDNVSGFKKRVSRLIGIENTQQRNLNHYKVESARGGWIVSIQCGSQTLTNKQIYPTQAAAQAGLEKFLSFALCENYYKPLTYKFFYHYGFEVEAIDNDEPIQARYHTHFFSQVDRATALPTLLQNLASSPPEITIQRDGELYYFQLNSRPNIQFTGVQRYFSEEAAITKATVLLQQLRAWQNYRPILFQTTGNAERESQSPSRETRFTHYGYALIDHKGTVLAESERFAQSEERDADLDQWLATIRAGQCSEVRSSNSESSGSTALVTLTSEEQFEFVLQSSGGAYYFVLQNATGHTVLRSLNAYPAKEAWKNAVKFAENLFYVNRYVNPAQNYALGITDEQGELLAISETEQVPLTLFKRLNSIERFLSVQSVQDGENLRYRCQLSDRTGAILLEATQLFSDAATARDRFYQMVLGVLFEPGLRYSSTDLEGFSFGVLSRPGNCQSKVAIHPRHYATEQERDAAVDRLFLLVRSVRITSSLNPQTSANVGRIYGQDGAILLQSTQRYENEQTGWEQGNLLMELASVEVEIPGNSQNFRLIDSQNNSALGGYGWELTNEAKDQIIASHFYKNQSDRDQAIKTLQQQVNDEGFHLLEHILLRPRRSLDSSETLLPIDPEGTDDSPFSIALRDPYSFWVTIVLPYWSARFRDINFRRFIEQTLRSEAPAHVALKIAWVEVHQMEQFETAYRTWLEQFAQSACEETACDLADSQCRLIQLLTQLRSVYPQGALAGSQDHSQPNPIVLNQSILGSAND
ncbi:hypothetical protein IQ250_05110 [Pseudanabaenaceae cyanobacterium LEGE 13415]|nr:hypothetical protein [Pseudanabaenaceae cyanobacterium LEGE 13415]